MTDILITPTCPISPRWRLDANSLIGHEWLSRYCISQTAYSYRDLRQLTARLAQQGVTFRIDWSIAITAVA